MAFSESIKWKVRRDAGFRCCWCDRFGVIHVHHIIPQAEGGPDTLENAAPLCPSCHADYGNNPDLRRHIEEKRNFLYKTIPYRYPIKRAELEACAIALEEVAPGNQAAVERTKEAVKTYLDRILAAMNPYNAADSVDRLVSSIPLDTGILAPPELIAFRDFCHCERENCVGYRGKVYCYFTSDLSQWVLASRLYYRCYDQLIVCPRCNQIHKRGHVGSDWTCQKPFSEDELQDYLAKGNVNRPRQNPSP